MGSEVHPGNGHISKKIHVQEHRFPTAVCLPFLIRPLNSNSMEFHVHEHVHETWNWAGFKGGVKGVSFRGCFSTLPIVGKIKIFVSADGQGTFRHIFSK